MKVCTMDHIDKKLLRLLQENARYSLKQLSERVYLSSPAVAARIDKLEREGVINGYHADANLDKMGYHIRMDWQMWDLRNVQLKKSI